MVWPTLGSRTAKEQNRTEPSLVHFFLYWPLHLRTGEWTTREYFFVNSRGYGVILVFRDWIRRLVPLFSGRWKNCRKFRRKKCDGM